MNLSDVAGFLSPLSDSISLYAAVERDTPADEIVAVALGSISVPEWLDRSSIERAIEDAREMDAAGVCWFGRSDGATFSAPLADPPRKDIAQIAPIPMLTPLAETMHRAVDHLVVQFDLSSTVLRFGHFPDDDEPSSWTYEVGSADPGEIASAIVHDVSDSVELVIVAVEERLQAAVVDRLDASLPPRVRVKAIDPGVDIADEAVRAVADFTAVELVESIRAFRFMESHDAVVEGLDATAKALAQGLVTKLFLTTAVDDMTLSVGAAPAEIGVDADGFIADHKVSARAGDALLRSAILQGTMVQIIPEHLHDGPHEGVGATLQVH